MQCACACLDGLAPFGAGQYQTAGEGCDHQGKSGTAQETHGDQHAGQEQER